MNWLFVLFEMFGTVGSQCEDVMFRLIGKQSGVGKRGIGEFRSLFLVWQRSRRPLVREWDATHANDGAFSVASGRSPTDAVWRQAVRQEHGVHSDQVAATVLWDVKQFYDSMWLRHFFAEGQSHSHPSAVLRLSLRHTRGQGSCRSTMSRRTRSSPTSQLWRGLPSPLLKRSCTC